MLALALFGPSTQRCGRRAPVRDRYATRPSRIYASAGVVRRLQPNASENRSLSWQGLKKTGLFEVFAAQLICLQEEPLPSSIRAMAKTTAIQVRRAPRFMRGPPRDTVDVPTSFAVRRMAIKTSFQSRLRVGRLSG